MHTRWRPGSGQNRWPEHWQGLRVTVSLLLFFVIALSIIGSWYVDLRVRPVMQRWASQSGINIATAAIASAVQSVAAVDIDQGSLIHFQNDAAGRIVGISFEWGRINNIVARLTKEIQSAINEGANVVIPVPMGQLTGVEILAAYGPPIPVRIIPVGAVTTVPRIEFLERGINQTLYRIYLDINTIVRIVAPLVREDIPVASAVPIVEQWVIGEVPQVYLNWQADLQELEHIIFGGGR